MYLIKARSMSGSRRAIFAMLARRKGERETCCVLRHLNVVRRLLPGMMNALTAHLT
ncbi:unnamed protein product [Periconia digitata]|uniref:Uncharacterized protein n=1 Tax=Periconia digitata TaxID=1303443 RepID=A0A9W4U3I6_9PLEO|nr:unnamed protein product [Periconia digitata]